MTRWMAPTSCCWHWLVPLRGSASLPFHPPGASPVLLWCARPQAVALGGRSPSSCSTPWKPVRLNSITSPLALAGSSLTYSLIRSRSPKSSLSHCSQRDEILRAHMSPLAFGIPRVHFLACCWCTVVGGWDAFLFSPYHWPYDLFCLT